MWCFSKHEDADLSDKLLCLKPPLVSDMAAAFCSLSICEIQLRKNIPWGTAETC